MLGLRPARSGAGLLSRPGSCAAHVAASGEESGLILLEKALDSSRSERGRLAARVFLLDQRLDCAMGEHHRDPASLTRGGVHGYLAGGATHAVRHAPQAEPFRPRLEQTELPLEP